MSERICDLNSERPVTASMASHGILIAPFDGAFDPVFTREIPELDKFYWTPDNIQSPPNPREKSQAEEDKKIWEVYDTAEYDLDEALKKYAAHIRADQEAKTRDEMRKSFDSWYKMAVSYSTHGGFDFAKGSRMDKDLRAIFDTPTTQERPQ